MLSIKFLLLSKMPLSHRANALCVKSPDLGDNLIVSEPLHSLSLVAPQVEELSFSLFFNKEDRDLRLGVNSILYF